MISLYPMRGNTFRMGAPKQKWTVEEEAALRAGVDKYGPGKWRAIQKDAEFGPFLMLRSNVDLKDKWRNMSVSAHGFGSKDRVSKVLSSNSDLDTSHTDLATPFSTMLEASSKGIILHSSPIKDKKPLGPRKRSIFHRWNHCLQLTTPICSKDFALCCFLNHVTGDPSLMRYENVITEAISSLEESNGSTRNQIANYIEDHYLVPSNFKNLLTQKLKNLTLQGKLIKMRQNYLANEHFEVSIEERDCKLWPPNEQQDGDINSKEGELQCLSGPKKTRSDARATKMKRKLGVTMFGAMTAAEAASIAAQAVAEAEAAAAAAEEAARAAEIAEAEWKAAEAAAEAAKAAFAAKSAKKPVKTLAVPQDEIAVTG